MADYRTVDNLCIVFRYTKLRPGEVETTMGSADL